MASTEHRPGTPDPNGVDKVIVVPDAGDPTKEVGFTGLRQQAGRIDEEFLPNLRGMRKIQTFKEMRENDPTIGAILFSIEMLIRQVDFPIVPGGEEDIDGVKAEFLRGCFDDMADTWQDTLAQILSFLEFGYSLAEEVYKVRQGMTENPVESSRFDDRRMGWKKLAPRAQETIQRWIFDPESGELCGAEQRSTTSGARAILPLQRLLLFRTTTNKGNPEGRSILRNAYRPWFFKKRIEEIEAIGIERDLAGLPVAWVPAKMLDGGASAKDKTSLANMQEVVRNIRRDAKEGVVFPLHYDENGNKVYDLTLLRSGGRRQFDTTAIITRYDQRIAMSVLEDFLLLGQQRVGSFALAASKTALFATAIGSWLDAITEVFNRFAIPRLFARNSFPDGPLPVLTHGDIETQDLEELGKYLTDLTSAGAAILPNPELERHLLEQANLPVPPEEQGE